MAEAGLAKDQAQATPTVRSLRLSNERSASISMRAENCNDPELGRQIFKWAMLRSGLEQEPSEVALRDHIASCPACGALVGQWKRKAEAGMALAEGDRVLAGDLRPDERVEERQLVDGRALFKFSHDNPNTGLLLLVGLDGRISSLSAKATRAEFEAASGTGG
jgi:hypothetical protein